MRVLGIDPGSRVTGIGIVDAAGADLQLRHFAALRLGDGPFPERLGYLFREIGAAASEHGVEAAAVETVYVKRNVETALKLGQARGAALAALVEADLAVGEYTPARIKEAVVGRGSAAKEQVGFMVRRLLGLTGSVPEDAADALAVAVCHAHHLQARSRLAASDGDSAASVGKGGQR